MDEITYNEKKYEIVSPQKADELSKRYEYWEVKEPNNIVISKSTKDDNIANALADNEDFGVLLVHFSDSPQNRLNVRRCMVVFDEQKLRGYRRKKKLGDADTEREQIS